MKLAAKLIAVTILAVLAVFAVRGYQNARRQMAPAESDARENAWLVGRALRPAIVDEMPLGMQAKLLRWCAAGVAGGLPTWQSATRGGLPRPGSRAATIG